MFSNIPPVYIFISPPICQYLSMSQVNLPASDLALSRGYVRYLVLFHIMPDIGNISLQSSSILWFEPPLHRVLNFSYRALFYKKWAFLSQKQGGNLAKLSLLERKTITYIFFRLLHCGCVFIFHFIVCLFHLSIVNPPQNYKKSQRNRQKHKQKRD